MDALNQFSNAYLSNALLKGIVGPAVICVLAYLVFRHRKEITRHAIQNNAATIVIVGLNCTAALLFVPQIDAFFQATYDALGIPTLDRAIWDGVPLWIGCLIGFVAKDFADYWTHRWMHTAWGWPAHAAHHSDTHVNAFTTFRVHTLEHFVMNASYIIVLTWMQLPEAIPFVVLLSLMHNMYVHMELPFDHGPFKLLLASPVFHRWHHADVPEAYGKNLANLMPLWDRLFGTYYAGGFCTEEMGAKKTGCDDKNPFSIYAYPFLEWARLVRQSIRPSQKTKPTQATQPPIPAE